MKSIIQIIGLIALVVPVIESKNPVRFALEGLKNPHKVGTIFTCSSYVGQELCRNLKRHTGPKRVLEMGAGTGNITEVIINYLTPQDELVCIEYLPELARQLKKTVEIALAHRFGDGPRPTVIVLCADALTYQDAPFDYVISTLPLNAFSAQDIARALMRMRSLVKDTGEIAQVAYKAFPHLRVCKEHLLYLARLKKERALHYRLTLVRRFMANYKIDKRVVVRNIPPINIYHVTGFADSTQTYPPLPEFLSLQS